MFPCSIKKKAEQNSDVLVHTGGKLESIRLLGQILGNYWKKVLPLQCSLASIKHRWATDELIFPRHMHFQKFLLSAHRCACSRDKAKG